MLRASKRTTSHVRTDMSIGIKHRDTGAILYSATADDLRTAVVSAVAAHADLAHADLRGANLMGANLRGANLTHAIGAIDCGTPDGWRIVIVRHDDDIRIAAGCRWFTLREAVAHWEGFGDRKRTRATLDYIRALCAVEGWETGENA